MITIDKLHFSYRSTKVFDNVSLRLKPGKIYGILGKNGTGKSTLLYSIAGLLYPKQGDIDVSGHKPQKREPCFLQDIFMVPEEFHLPDISFNKLVKQYGKFYPKFNEEQFFKYLENFAIPHDQTLLKMSYGQKKKALISFALSSNASVLLLDEPSNGLDIIAKTQLRKALTMALDENKCILISSHQVQDLTNLIDDVIVLDHTKIVIHESLRTIGEKLSFKISSDTQDLQSALFSEPVLGGNSIVTVNENKNESSINLELFYKALVHNPQGIHYALNE